MNHKKLFPKTDLQTRQMNDCAIAELEYIEKIEELKRRLRKEGKQQDVFDDANLYFKCMLILGRTSMKIVLYLLYFNNF